MSRPRKPRNVRDGTRTYEPTVEHLSPDALRQRRKRARDELGLKQYPLALNEELVQEALTRDIPPGTELEHEVVIEMLTEILTQQLEYYAGRRK